MAKNTIKDLSTSRRTTSFQRLFNNTHSNDNLIETSKNVRSFERLFNNKKVVEVVEEPAEEPSEETPVVETPTENDNPVVEEPSEENTGNGEE